MLSKFRMASSLANRAVSKSPFVRALSTDIPGNVQGWYVQEMEDSQKSQSATDRYEMMGKFELMSQSRSRETSGQRTQASPLFSSAFMSSQPQDQVVDDSAGMNDQHRMQQLSHDMNGGAQLDAIIQVQIPLPRGKG